MDNFDQQIAGAKGASVASALPELSTYFTPVFQNQQMGSVGSAIGVSAANKAEADRQAAAAAKAQQEAALKQKIQAAQDAVDPAKFYRVKKEDGGFDFFDPTGKPITAWQFSQVRQIDPDQALKGSTNENDLKFMNDWKNMQTFLQANAEGNDKVLNKIYQEQPGIKDMKYQDLLKQFRNSYTNIFGHYEGEQGSQANTRVVTSPSIIGYNQQVDSGLQGGNNSGLDTRSLGGSQQGAQDFMSPDQSSGMDIGQQSPNQTGMNAYIAQQEEAKKKKPWWEQIGSWLSGGG